MAELLKVSAADRRFWAVDKVILGYLVFTSVLLVGWWSAIPNAAALAAAHLGGVALLLIEIKVPNPTSWYFRCWYPLPYVGPATKRWRCWSRRSATATPTAGWPPSIFVFGARIRPSGWSGFTARRSPNITDRVHAVCAGGAAGAVSIVAQAAARRVPILCVFNCVRLFGVYVGYLLVPALGPRFLLKPLEHLPLRGLWLFQNMQHSLNRLESTAYDCFPSGHTELTILACWMSRIVSNRLFWVYFCYTLSIIFATVYLRYHYTVDLLAGAALAVTLILASPFCYRILRERA